MKLLNDLRKRRISTLLNFHPAPANSRTNWPGEPNVQMISLSELLHETRLRVKPVEQRAKVWVLVGGYRGCSKNRGLMDMLQAFRAKFEQTAAKANSYFLKSCINLYHQYVA